MKKTNFLDAVQDLKESVCIANSWIIYQEKGKKKKNRVHCFISNWHSSGEDRKQAFFLQSCGLFVFDQKEKYVWYPKTADIKPSQQDNFLQDSLAAGSYDFFLLLKKTRRHSTLWMKTLCSFDHFFFPPHICITEKKTRENMLIFSKGSNWPASSELYWHFTPNSFSLQLHLTNESPAGCSTETIHYLNTTHKEDKQYKIYKWPELIMHNVIITMRNLLAKFKQTQHQWQLKQIHPPPFFVVSNSRVL